MLRVSAACELLLETRGRIADISEEVGFGSIRSFNRAFLKIMGRTPKEYRENVKKNSRGASRSVRVKEKKNK